jgi:hypothetical protein
MLEQTATPMAAATPPWNNQMAKMTRMTITAMTISMRRMWTVPMPLQLPLQMQMQMPLQMQMQMPLQMPLRRMPLSHPLLALLMYR